MQPSTVPSSAGSLAMYLAEINRYPLLTVDEEQRLARLYARILRTSTPRTNSSPRTSASW